MNSQHFLSFGIFNLARQRDVRMVKAFTSPLVTLSGVCGIYLLSTRKPKYEELCSSVNQFRAFLFFTETNHTCDLCFKMKMWYSL